MRSDQVAVWNRATMERGGSHPESGEAANAVRWTTHQIEGVILDEDSDDAERIELEADRRYGEAVPDDERLYNAFVRVLTTSPDAFAPT